MDDLISFSDRLWQLLQEREISSLRFEQETGISRKILYNYKRKINKSMLMGIAYYLDMRVEELVEGTTAMDSWHS